MRISDGIAEISLVNTARETAGIHKVYLWPQYNAGTVNPVRTVTPRDGTAYAYQSVRAEEREFIRDDYSSRRSTGYSATGSISRRTEGLPTGMLFDARA